MADVLTNRASFTLAAAITSATQTSITRTSAANGLPGDSNGPASGTYKFVMTDGNGNYEIAQVTGGQGTTTLTIARAVELIGGVQTALASVANGTVCYAVATAGDLASSGPTIPSYDTTVLTKLSLAPVAYWKLNEPAGSSTAADSSGNGYNLTKVGTGTFGNPGLVPSDSETCWQGDGTSGYLNSGANVPLPTAAYTALAVVKITGVPSGYQMVVAWGSTYQLGFNTGSGGNVPWFINVNADQNCQPTGPIGSPHVYAISYDGHQVTGYLDGQPLVGIAPSGTAPAEGFVTVGGAGNSNWAPWPLGRVAIFAGVLTPKDWRLLMQAFTGVS